MFFYGAFSIKILAVCKVCIEGQFIIKNGLLMARIW